MTAVHCHPISACFVAMFYYCHGDVPESFFRVSRKKLMRFSRIKSVATYHKCIRELVEYNYIQYRPSYDPYLASMVSLFTNPSTAYTAFKKFPRMRRHRPGATREAGLRPGKQFRCEASGSVLTVSIFEKNGASGSWGEPYFACPTLSLRGFDLYYGYKLRPQGYRKTRKNYKSGYK